MNREHKTFHFKATNVASEQRNGVNIGIIEGYASTWELDRGDDMIMQGAFTKTISEHMNKGRQIRMYAGHDNSKLIGGYPIEFVREDAKGLFVRGEVNIDVQDGKEAYSLAKQGVLSDMSIGFSIPDYKMNTEMKMVGDRMVRCIKELALWEISLVPEPMNAGAKVTAVKSFDLPIAPRDTEVNSESAQTYLIDTKTLSIGNEINGVMTIIPKAVFACASTLIGARGALTIDEDSIQEAKHQVESLYKKMGLLSPFEGDVVDITLVEACTNAKEVEQLLRFKGFSQLASKAIVRILKSTEHREDEIGDSAHALNEKFAELNLLGKVDTLKLTMRSKP